VVRAFGTGDIGQIASAIRNGVGAVVQAPIKFTVAVVRDIVDEVTKVVRPSTPTTPMTDTPAVAAESLVAAAQDVEPEAETAAPVKKLRTTRTVKKAGRPGVAAEEDLEVAEKASHTAGLSAERKVTPIAPKQAERPERKPADNDSADAEQDAA
jgi:microcompartment protein CcmL/EutN